MHSAHSRGLYTMPTMLEVCYNSSKDMSLLLRCFKQATYEAMLASLNELRNLADHALHSMEIDHKRYTLSQLHSFYC
jgi:hypothetical protein